MLTNVLEHFHYMEKIKKPTLTKEIFSIPSKNTSRTIHILEKKSCQMEKTFSFNRATLSVK